MAKVSLADIHYPDTTDFLATRESLTFKVISAESFADIFRGNCLKNGILTVTLAKETLNRLFDETRLHDEYRITVDVKNCALTPPDGSHISFNIKASTQEKLLNDWDDIELTLNHAEKIHKFEASRRCKMPWLFAE